MLSWTGILAEIKNNSEEDWHGYIRRRYLEKLATYTYRPTIVYDSGWLQSTVGGRHPHAFLNDLDMNAFMAAVHDLDFRNGLDLVLHTPGGEIEASRALVEYLHKLFGQSIQVIVPHIALSAGTMIACARDKITLSKHSSLGPTDPQINGRPATGIVNEVDRALNEIKRDPQKEIFWREVFRQLPSAFITDCERAIKITGDIVTEWLRKGMLRDTENPEKKARQIVENLMSLKDTMSHGHHFMIEECQGFGLNVEPLGDEQRLQELVLRVHHSYVASMAHDNSIKLVENHQGQSWSIEA